jgi:hypothetical protein
MSSTISESVTKFVKWLTDFIKKQPNDGQGEKVMLQMNIAQLYIDYMMSAGNTWLEHLIMIFRMTAYIPSNVVIKTLNKILSEMPLKNHNVTMKMLHICMSIDDMTIRRNILRALSEYPFALDE